MTMEYLQNNYNSKTMPIFKLPKIQLHAFLNPAADICTVISQAGLDVLDLLVKTCFLLDGRWIGEITSSSVKHFWVTCTIGR